LADKSGAISDPSFFIIFKRIKPDFESPPKVGTFAGKRSCSFEGKVCLKLH
jgi:hypothetical protein